MKVSQGIANSTQKKPAQAAMPSPGSFVSGFNPNGQAINTGAILQGYQRETQVRPNTGTATGDQAARDFAKAQSMQGQAAISRNAATQNAKFQTQLQAQQEQLTQQGRAARMQRFAQLAGQHVNQMNLANELARQRLAMQTQWRTGLIGLLS